ncbi:MAG: DUF3098 domain-containing protein [Chitinophagales bacterium]|nr:DUF3098 domain-containing protein [Chitinophagaceae bacterium]MCB9063852.1 DUF3098 domain-containing protein [Chitinophagales bacterium]
MAKEKAKSNNQPLGNQTFLFDKSNYMWMIGGVVLVIIGFMLMTGGKNEDPTKFDYDVIYSTTRITIAPLLILIGFGIEVFAIMKKPAGDNAAKTTE